VGKNGAKTETNSSGSHLCCGRRWCALLVALGPIALGIRALLNQGPVEVAQFIDRVCTADLLFFLAGEPWKPIFEQCENHPRAGSPG
jgi:hypothetical protein